MDLQIKKIPPWKNGFIFVEYVETFWLGKKFQNQFLSDFQKDLDFTTLSCVRELQKL